MNTTVECETFIYQMKDFERDIMCWVEMPPAKDMRRMLEVDLADKPKCFRDAVYKRILTYKNKTGRWWIDNYEYHDKNKDQEELMAIWKMGIDLCRGFYIQCYEDKSPEDSEDERPTYRKAIDSWFHDSLESDEVKLKKGEINENQYLIRCMNMKNHKKQVEDLLGACVCSTMCRINKGNVDGNPIPTNLLRFVCLPCGFI